MSEADNLLATLSVDYSDEAYIFVNDDRSIVAPDELKHIAVEHDHNIETVIIDCPRYWDGHDFSKMTPYVNYMRPDGYKDSYRAKNLRVSDEDDTRIFFNWTISANVTQIKGNISFLVYIEDPDANPCWHSRLNQQMIIDEGLTCKQQIEMAPDSIEEVLARTTASYIAEAKAEIEGKTALALASIPEDYTTVNNMAQEALREKSNVIKMEAEGEVITVNDSADNALLSLKIYGKTTQVNTTGAQLFDKDTAVIGMLEKDGSIAVDAAYVTSDYIPITPNTAYYQTDKETIRSKYYDASKKPLSSAWDMMQTTAGTFTTAANAYYFRVTVRCTYVDSYMLNLGSKAVPYEPYSGGAASPSPDWPQELVSIGDRVEMIAGYWNTIEQFVYGSGHITTPNFIPCTAGDVIAVTVENGFDTVSSRCFNDESVYIAPSVSAVGNTVTWTIPSGATRFYPIFVKEGLTPSNAGKVTLTVNGNHAVGLTLRGKNLWNVTNPTLGNTSTYSLTKTGVSFTRGSVTGGTYVCCNVPINKGQTVTFSAIGDNYSPSLVLYEDKIYGKRLASGTGTLTYTAETNIPSAVFALVVNSTDGDCEFSNIQVEYGATVTAYEHPRPVQSFGIRMDIALPGIPVTSGGNYTDSDGQQWICDEIDFERGVYVQRIGFIQFNGDENWAYYTSGDGVNQFYTIVNNCYTNNASVNALSPQLKGIRVNDRSYNYGTVYTAFQNPYDYVCINAKDYTSQSEFKSYLSTSPVDVMYRLKTPIETPLTDAELASFKMVRSNYPDTTVLNDSGAHMSIKYAGDTKTYVDNNSLSNGTLVDTTTGKAYRLAVTNGQLTLVAV